MSFLSWLNNGLNAWRSYSALQTLDNNALVFYAESQADWAHLRPILDCLLEKHRQKVVCVTSDCNDSILAYPHEMLQTFFIGSGTARTLFFQSLKAKAMVLTLTDLDVYFLKRSINPVHYFYVFHALVSTHAAYRAKAFDAYDTIFCVGPYQVDEIRLREKVGNLPGKNLVQGGYCRLDQLIARTSTKCDKTEETTTTVLVSPTWGNSSVVASCLEKILQILTQNRFNTILRLHPMTLRHFPNLPLELEKKFADSGFFTFDRRLQAIESLLQADLMIADHGGSGIEFALGLLKPVISIATPAKMHNPERDKIPLPLFEDLIRPATGSLVQPDQLDQLPQLINDMKTNAQNWKKKLEQLRQQYIFNTGCSATMMAEYIHNFILNSNKDI